MRRTPTFRKRRSRKPRLFAYLLTTFFILAWAHGLGVFTEQIPKQINDTQTQTDAIVVLTGGSERLEVGMNLYESAIGKKLFISGVNKRVQVKNLLATNAISAERVACCIELGYAATNTIGNGRETANWMTREGFRSLRLVTASYHMPRSLLEFHRAMPGTKILAHPVFPENFHPEQWWRWPGSTRLILVEYHKFLLAHLRSLAYKIADHITAS